MKNIVLTAWTLDYVKEKLELDTDYITKIKANKKSYEIRLKDAKEILDILLEYNKEDYTIIDFEDRIRDYEIIIDNYDELIKEYEEKINSYEEFMKQYEEEIKEDIEFGLPEKYIPITIDFNELGK